jgi:hypothetical protein
MQSWKQSAGALPACTFIRVVMTDDGLHRVLCNMIRIMMNAYEALLGRWLTGKDRTRQRGPRAELGASQISHRLSLDRRRRPTLCKEQRMSLKNLIFQHTRWCYVYVLRRYHGICAEELKQNTKTTLSRQPISGYRVLPACELRCHPLPVRPNISNFCSFFQNQLAAHRTKQNKQCLVLKTLPLI